jgi:sulfur-oxidizing protein SoxY
MAAKQANHHATARRTFLTRSGTLAAALLCALLRPLQVAAAQWHKAAFDAKNVQDALKAAGVVNPAPSADILVKAPEIAENGAQVPIEISSAIPGTHNIRIFVDKNVQPYVASFDFKPGVEPFISTRIKMGETSILRVIVTAGGKQYIATREVKVTIGGCGT